MVKVDLQMSNQPQIQLNHSLFIQTDVKNFVTIAEHRASAKSITTTTVVTKEESWLKMLTQHCQARYYAMFVLSSTVFALSQGWRVTSPQGITKLKET